MKKFLNFQLQSVEYSDTCLKMLLQFRKFMINFMKILLQFGSFKIYFKKIQLSFIKLRKISEHPKHFPQF